MANNFRRFKEGIQIAPVLSADPLEGQIGEIYCNATTNTLRVCLSASPLIWQDLMIAPGTAPFATLFWDDVGKAWVTNEKLLANENILYTPEAPGGTSLIIRTGQATDPGEVGGSLFLELGDGDAGRGSILTNANLIGKLETAIGETFRILGGSATDDYEKGGSVTVEAGQGGLDAEMGDIELIADRLYFSLDKAVNFGITLVEDPTDTLESDLFYHKTFGKFRYHDGGGWRFVGEKGYNQVDLFDDSETALPTETTTLIDGVVITQGMVVVFAALNPDTPGYFFANVDGTDITWTPINIAQSADGSFSLGDRILVKYGTANALAEKFYNGWEWKSLLSSGTEDASILHWDSGANSWVENSRVRIDSNAFRTIPDTDDDASQAPEFSIQGTEKTAGTGDGGDIVIAGGESFGGNRGKVALIGDLIELSASRETTPATSAPGQLYFNSIENRFWFSDSGTWRPLEGPRGVGTVQYRNTSVTELPDKTGPEIDSISVLGTTVTVETDGDHYLTVGETVDIAGVITDSWVDSTTYDTDDVVEFEGQIYQSLVDDNEDNQPDESPAEWDVITDIFNGTRTVTAVNSSTEFTYTSPVTVGVVGASGGYIDSLKIDGIKVTNDMTVLFVALVTDPNAYRAIIDGNDVVWRPLYFGQGATAAPQHGDVLRVLEGASRDTTWWFNSSSWVDEGVNAGFLDHSILHWDSLASKWVPENTIQIHDYTIWGRDDEEDDADPAADLTLKASAKTDGTGDGGDLYLQSGTSVGGENGKVILVGDRVRLVCSKASDPVSGTAGDIYYNTTINKFKFYDGAAWYPLGGELPQTVSFNDGDTGVLLTQVAVAQYNMLQIDFSIRRGSALERGTLWVASDGSAATASATGTGWGDPELNFTADVDSGNLRVRFDTQLNGDNGSIMFVIREKWLHA